MRNRSAAKVKQVTEMMNILHLRMEARERMNEQGFIEKIVFWIDDEQYKPADGPIPQTVIDKEVAASAPTESHEKTA